MFFACKVPYVRITGYAFHVPGTYSPAWVNPFLLKPAKTARMLKMSSAETVCLFFGLFLKIMHAESNVLGQRLSFGRL